MKKARRVSTEVRIFVERKRVREETRDMIISKAPFYSNHEGDLWCGGILVTI